MTLQEIITNEQANRRDGGDFGITACKEAIEFDVKYNHMSLYQCLEAYVERANKDVFFNRAMVLACWEMINEH